VGLQARLLVTRSGFAVRRAVQRPVFLAARALVPAHPVTIVLLDSDTIRMDLRRGGQRQLTSAWLRVVRAPRYGLDELLDHHLTTQGISHGDASGEPAVPAAYGSLVLALGQLFGTVGERTPSWAVAAAAALTVQAFSIRLRDQIDLDTLTSELLAVVDQTMEPTRVSVWLRASSHGPLGTAGSEARSTPWTC
jgi:hypothetical protein